MNLHFTRLIFCKLNRSCLKKAKRIACITICACVFFVASLYLADWFPIPKNGTECGKSGENLKLLPFGFSMLNGLRNDSIKIYGILKEAIQWKWRTFTKTGSLSSFRMLAKPVPSHPLIKHVIISTSVLLCTFILCCSRWRTKTVDDSECGLLITCRPKKRNTFSVAENILVILYRLSRQIKEKEQRLQALGQNVSEMRAEIKALLEYTDGLERDSATEMQTLALPSLSERDLPASALLAAGEETAQRIIVLNQRLRNLKELPNHTTLVYDLFRRVENIEKKRLTRSFP